MILELSAAQKMRGLGLDVPRYCSLRPKGRHQKCAILYYWDALYLLNLHTVQHGIVIHATRKESPDSSKLSGHLNVGGYFLLDCLCLLQTDIWQETLHRFSHLSRRKISMNKPSLPSAQKNQIK
jgi:hypothetical protein